MKKNDENHIDQEFNTPFDQWLRENEPSGPEYTFDVESSLEGFRAKMKANKVARAARLKKRVVQGSVVTCVLLLSFGAFNMTDVGSDGFNMVEVEVSVGPGRAMKNEFRGGGFHLLGDETEMEIERLNEKISSKDYVVIGADGYLVDGKIYWFISREYTVLGNVHVLTAMSTHPKSNPSKEIITFLSEKWAVYEKQIDDGEIRPSDRRTIQEIDGIKFSVLSWELDVSKGKTVYFKGVPTH